MCTFCFREKETIEHVLYECEKVQRFLSTVATWFLKNIFTLNIDTEKNLYLVVQRVNLLIHVL